MRGRVPGGSSSHALHPGKFGFSSSAQNEAESASMQSVAISRNQCALSVHSACNQCNKGASALTCQGVTHARVEEAGLLRTAHVCVPEPTHLGERELDHAGVVPACMQVVAISRNQSQSVAIRDAARGGRSHPRECRAYCEIGAPAGSIMGNQGRSHLGDRTLASAGRTAEIGAPAGSTAVTRASAEPAAALAPS